MTAMTKQPTTPVDHLTRADIEAIGAELDAIRQEVIDTRGERDAAYIRKVVKVHRGIELGSRAVLVASGFWPAWLLGTAGLAVSKIIDNMEIGHNVLHGQWDWMRDPKIHSTTWDWDHVSPAEQWKHAHNEVHHTFTNIVGKDNDLGYGIMRVDEDQPWTPRSLRQPFLNLFTMLTFEYGIAAYDLDMGGNLQKPKAERDPEFPANARRTLRKIAKQVRKDYLLYPLLSGPWFFRTLAANATAGVIRNVWSHSVIMCGHFPEGVQTFERDELDPSESKAEWYLRQMLGSANISGPWLMHFMSGNLSHQIEHHIFPDLPSNRYAEIAPKVRALFEKYDLPYHTNPLPKQTFLAWHKVVRLSFPNGWLETTNASNLRSQLKLLWQMARGDERTRRRIQNGLDAAASAVA